MQLSTEILESEFPDIWKGLAVYESKYCDVGNYLQFQVRKEICILWTEDQSA